MYAPIRTGVFICPPGIANHRIGVSRRVVIKGDMHFQQFPLAKDVFVRVYSIAIGRLRHKRVDVFR